MAIYTRIPLPQPLRFVKYAIEATNNKYHTAGFDGDLAYNNLRKGQRRVWYYQKVQNDQIVTIQAHTTSTTTHLHILDMHKNTLGTLSSVTYDMPGNLINGEQLHTHQWSFNLASSGLPDGLYSIELVFVDPAGVSVDQRWISETIDLKDYHEETILLEYSHNSNDIRKDIVFLDPLNPVFAFRVDGLVKFDRPTSVSTEFRDAAYVPKVLSSINDRDYTLVLGYDQPVAEWVVDKVDNIVNCDNWTADGKLFVRKPQAEFEVTDTANYPLQSATLAILEGDRQGNFERTTDDILFFEEPSYPYGIGLQKIYGPATAYISTVGKVIEDTAGADAYVSGLPAEFPLLGGTFFRSAGSIYYTRTPSENVTTGFVELDPVLLNINVHTNNPSDIFKVQTHSSIGGKVVIDWGDGTIEYKTNLTVNFNHVYAFADDYIVRVFHNNSFEKFVFSPGTALGKITDMSGDLPNVLTEFTLNKATLSTLDLAQFQTIRDTCTYFAITDSGLSAITGDMFAAGGFNNLTAISFTKNALADTDVDDLFNNFYNNADWPVTGGSFNTSLQSPTAPPTSASLAARTALVNAGEIITTD